MGIFDFFRKRKNEGEPARQHPVAGDASAPEAAPVLPRITPHAEPTPVMPEPLRPWLPRLQAGILPSVAISVAPGEEAPSTRSKFGGWPAWPIDDPWPIDSRGEAMFPLAQINFADVPPLEGYPVSGLLQIFISTEDTYGLDFENPKSQKDFAVYFFPTWEEEKLRRDFSDLKIDYDQSPLGRSLALGFQPEGDWPYPGDIRFEKLIGMEMDAFIAQFGEAEDEVMEYLYDYSGNGHKIGGYAYFAQEDPRRYLDGEDHILLLQIDSDNHIMWGDAGVANFFIRPEDLKRLDFSKVWYNWDCS